MIWADISSLLNHCYLLLTLSAVYDEALFFRNNEIEELGKTKVNVQFIVEWPQIYILARCWSSEVEQVAYINTRNTCLQGLDNKMVTSDGDEITDVMRFFHGNGPQQESTEVNRRVVRLAVQPAGARIYVC